MSLNGKRGLLMESRDKVEHWCGVQNTFALYGAYILGLSVVPPGNAILAPLIRNNRGLSPIAFERHRINPNQLTRLVDSRNARSLNMLGARRWIGLAEDKYVLDSGNHWPIPINFSSSDASAQ